MLHNVRGKSVCVRVCVVVWVQRKQRSTNIYKNVPGIVRQARTNLGVPYMHVQMMYVICGMLRAWCLGFSWSVVHVKPRAYKLEARDISYHSQ